MHVDDAIVSDLLARIHDAIGMLNSLPGIILAQPFDVRVQSEGLIRELHQTAEGTGGGERIAVSPNQPRIRIDFEQGHDPQPVRRLL